MDPEVSLRRSQIYAFLAAAFLYPQENWTEDLPVVTDLARGLEVEPMPVPPARSLEDLQAEHRRTFGLTGSLCYETEYGAPNEYFQAHQLADLAGFYRAFGFQVGGTVRERPDHIATELEFMHLLALKAALAAQRDERDHLQVCLDAQRKFLGEHLGRWVPLFARALATQVRAVSAGGSLDPAQAVYPALGEFAARFVTADAARLGVQVQELDPRTTRPTPFDPDFSCAGCPLAPETLREGQTP